MSSANRLRPADLEALRTGRAIPFFINNRVAELPGHTLSVIARLDDEQFHGVLIADDEPSPELVTLELTAPLVLIDEGASLESKDAAAVHRLWQRWHGGVREAYLNLARQIAIAIEIEQLENLLEIPAAHAPTDTGHTEDATPPNAPRSTRRKRDKARKAGDARKASKPTRAKKRRPS